MWLLLAATAGAAEPEAPLLREPPPYGLPPKVEWVVRYTDGSPLDTATFLRVTDAPPELRDEFLRVQNRRMAVGVTLAATGMAIAIVGSITSAAVAASTYDPETGTGAEFYGIAIGTGVVGTLLAVAGVPSLTNHSRARKYPAMALTESQADELIAKHNAALSSP